MTEIRHGYEDPARKDAAPRKFAHFQDWMKQLLYWSRKSIPGGSPRRPGLTPTAQ